MTAVIASGVQGMQPPHGVASQGPKPAGAVDSEQLPGASVLEVFTQHTPDEKLLAAMSGNQRWRAAVAATMVLARDWTQHAQPDAQAKAAQGITHVWHAGGDVKPGWRSYPPGAFDSDGRLCSVSVDLDQVRALGGLDDSRADSMLSLWGISNARRVDVALSRSRLTGAASASPRLDLELRVAPRSIPPEGDHERPWLMLSSSSPMPADLETLAQAAAWHCLLTTDAKGIGAIGPRGGAGSLAGLIRLVAESRYVMGLEADQAWSQRHSAWRSASDDAIRLINQSSRQEILVLGLGESGGQLASTGGVVLVVPLRPGANEQRVQQALVSLATHMGIEGTWQQTPAGSSLQGRLANPTSDSGQAASWPVSIGLGGGGSSRAEGGGEGSMSRFAWIGLGAEVAAAQRLWAK